MDDLERDLRSTLDQLADGETPSDGLVARTVERGAQLRRHRRVVAASSFAVLAVAVAIGVASLAGAGTRGSQVRITNPTISEAPTTSIAVSTTTSLDTTTTIPVFVVPNRPGHSNPKVPTPTTVPLPRVSFIPAACPAGDSGNTPESQTFTLLASGDVRVHISWTISTLTSTFVAYQFDDGSTGSTDFTKDYAPADFGTHSYKEWDIGDSGYVGCSTRHAFDVDPATATPDTTPGTVDTTSTTTTVPVTTSVPTTTTTVAP